MLEKIKKFLLGSPLESEELQKQKYDVIWGLPVLSSDAISSVAYAVEEVLLVLVPILGFMAYRYMLYISGAIILLLAILVFSYSQTIEKYPNGGGAFIVASDNLGKIPGITAGAALAIDYIMTVAVSVSSGVEQITSAFVSLKPYSVLIALLIVFVLMIGNLRGLRESSRVFGLPTYAFIVGIMAMIVWGFVKLHAGYNPPIRQVAATGTVSTFLLLRAFSNGSSALTGVEAVSNGIPNFKEPAQKNARIVLFLLGFLVFITFGSVAVLVNLYHIVPGNTAVIVQLANQVFGKSFGFYYVTATTFIILVIASNTAYSDFPLLMSIMAREGYVPHQLSRRGDRLSFSNGIILLSAVSALLIVVFRARVTSLIGLYAIGVFISFTLSQVGMFKRWITERSKNWRIKAAINGFGGLVTAVIVVIVAITKFSEGAWIVVVLLPLLVYVMLRINQHYNSVACQLRIGDDELPTALSSEKLYRNRVIVPIDSVNKASVRALRYAKTISDNVVAFNVSIDEEREMRLRKRYDELDIDIPLVVYRSPYRKIVEPLLKFIDSEEYDNKSGDIITVIMPEFMVTKNWHKLLHDRTRQYIESQLLRYRHIVVATMPYQLEDDRSIK